MLVWRPAFYTTKEELEKELDRYFEEVPMKDWTVTWLAIFLWFTSRQALDNYENKAEFVDPIKKAKFKVEHSYEVSLRETGRTGDIFALKNFWWKDKQEIEWDMKNTNMDVTDWTTLEQKKLIAQLFIKNNGQTNTDWDVEG